MGFPCRRLALPTLPEALTSAEAPLKELRRLSMLKCAKVSNFLSPGVGLLVSWAPHLTKLAIHGMYLPC